MDGGGQAVGGQRGVLEEGDQSGRVDEHRIGDEREPAGRNDTPGQRAW